MNSRDTIGHSQVAIAAFFHEVSQVITSVERLMLKASFVPLGDSAVFKDISASFEHGSRWIPSFAARAYVKGKKPTQAVGFCIHFGPYEDPACLTYLAKSHLVLPFVSIACLRDMKPGPLELDRRLIWDRIWDSGWWATYEDTVKGPTRAYSTTKDISGFQATIVGALTDFFPLDGTAERIVTPLLLLHEGREEELIRSTTLLQQI